MTEEPAWDREGLVAAIIQDSETAQVLMLGWMNREALDATRRSGRATFWSRSRRQLWEKGETSGNWLEVVSISSDCDGDALLLQVRPHGPTCHTGQHSCWSPDPTPGFAGLDHLWEVIGQRASERPDGSYTSALLAMGPEGVGRKLVEEATEALLAAKDQAAGTADERRVAEEVADVLYHLLVLLAERRIAPSAVLDILVARRR